MKKASWQFVILAVIIIAIAVFAFSSNKKKENPGFIDAGDGTVKVDASGRKYIVEGLPEIYDQIIEFLIKKKGYKKCLSDNDILYNIDEDSIEKIIIEKKEKTTKREELK